MPKIITVTANTAIDLNICVDNLHSADNMIAQSCEAYAAGKGINVAKALESLACPTIAMGFVGQQSQSLFSDLKSALLHPEFIIVPGRTRTNLTLRELNPNKETHIRTAGFGVTNADSTKLRQQLQDTIQKDDLIIFSGSLPSGCSDLFYADLINLCKQQRAITLLDSSGKSLAAGIQARPEVIKPNQSELEELVGTLLPDTQSIIEAARNLIAAGIKLVAVSRGKLGVTIVTADTAISAHIKPDISNCNSTIGCGDAMVAGLAYAMLNKLEYEEMIKFSLSCATANLFSAEPGRFSKTLMEDYKSQVIINNHP